VSDAGTIHSQRYQRWSGKRRLGRWTWAAMLISGLKLRIRDARNVVLLIPSAGLMIAAATFFYILMLLEQLAGSPRAQGLYDFVFNFLRVDVSSVGSLAAFRSVLWRSVFSFMMKIELFYLLILIARLGPSLIADDLKARALPIYFARPITPLTYLWGKWLTIAVFIALGMLVPNLLALFFGTLLTGGLPTWAETLGLALKLGVVGLAAALVGGLLILALSSLTSDKRFVAVGWLAVMLLPALAQRIVNKTLSEDVTNTWLGSLSLPGNLTILMDRLLDLRAGWESSGLPAEAFQAALGRPVDPMYPLIVLSVVTLCAGLLCYRRVLRFCRAAANL